MAQNEKTSLRVASFASKLLRGSTSKTVKSIAGSALAQAPDRGFGMAKRMIRPRYKMSRDR